MYEKCYRIAETAHKGQKRKIGGQDYITHPIAVANHFEDEKLRCIAILHDVIEDTAVTAVDLLKGGVPREIVEIVNILSRTEFESYVEFIKRILKNQTAISVKIADIQHNLSDLHKGTLRDKYELALYILKERLENGMDN